ncbi:MAG: helix-turn-helix domain-containing protein [Bacteroidetes bacterium]|nr:helix-turn-helix domain-containing protein [Bacteroidota bacterium]
MKEFRMLEINQCELKTLIESALRDVLLEMLPQNIASQNEADELLSQKQACLMLKVSPVTLWTWRKEKKVSYKKIGRKVFYSKRDLLKLNN